MNRKLEEVDFCFQDDFEGLRIPGEVTANIMERAKIELEVESEGVCELLPSHNKTRNELEIALYEKKNKENSFLKCNMPLSRSVIIAGMIRKNLECYISLMNQALDLRKFTQIFFKKIVLQVAK